jgi:hypothetical protein
MGARLTEDQIASIMADYHVGMSQNSLSLKHKVSKGAINKLCKGIEPKNEQLVTTLARARVELAGQDYRSVTAVNRAVTERTQDMMYFRSASLSIIEKALEMTSGANIFELERVQNIIGKGKENIYGKAPETAVQVNNQIAKYGWEE